MTILTNNKDGQRFVSLLDRLGRMSVEDYYNPYRMFKWPEMLPKDQLWMSRDLLSVYGTPAMDRLSEEQIIRLGIWESVNFYSLNVHGIRELLTEVINRVHMPGFEVPSEFFHHFIGEENEHMWFFAEFCRRYGEKFYYFPRIKLTAPADDAIENFLVFARILMFEEIVDYYNQRMADDESLHETIRQINRIHHRDESRHIAFGRELVSLLWARLHERLDDAELASIREYLRDYFRFCLHSFYSLDAYEDAKIDDPIAFRQELITSPRRAQAHERVVRKPLSYLRKTGIFDEGTIL